MRKNENIKKKQLLILTQMIYNLVFRTFDLYLDPLSILGFILDGSPIMQPLRTQQVVPTPWSSVFF